MCSHGQADTHGCICTPQVHLTVDTSLAKDSLGVAAFVSRVLTLGEKTLGTEFVEVSCEVLFGDVEKVGGGWRLAAGAGVQHAYGRAACSFCQRQGSL